MARSKHHTLIVAAKRTPILRIKKKWGNVSAMELGAAVIHNLLADDMPKPDQVIMGNYANPREALNPAKAACDLAGFDYLNAFTVNKVCSSGLLSIILGNAMIKSGDADLIIAGGMENLLGFPEEKIQELLRDPNTGEMTWHAGDWCANGYGISRFMQDSWAMESYSRAWHAFALNDFHSEIIPFQGLEHDEEPFRGVNEDDIRNAELFEGCKTITAMNSSKNSGGAAGVVLASEAYAKRYSLMPLARILGTSSIAMGK